MILIRQNKMGKITYSMHVCICRSAHTHTECKVNAEWASNMWWHLCVYHREQPHKCVVCLLSREKRDGKRDMRIFITKQMFFSNDFFYLMRSIKSLSGVRRSFHLFGSCWFLPFVVNIILFFSRSVFVCIQF